MPANTTVIVRCHRCTQKNRASVATNVVSKCAACGHVFPRVKLVAAFLKALVPQYFPNHIEDV